MTVSQDSGVAAAAAVQAVLSGVDGYFTWVENQKKLLDSFKVIFNWLLQELPELQLRFEMQKQEFSMW